MAEHYRTDVPMKHGVKTYLEEQKRKGIRMCIASATAEDLMEICLRRLGLRDYFEFLVSCETIGKGKHQPDVYLAAMEKLGATVENVKIYEDAKYAIRTAKKAGFHVVGIYDRNSVPYWDEICGMADEVILDWEKGIESV
jgi:HAD superfamily hydrolase (TIGR01509 family)